MAILRKTARFKHYATLECGNGFYVDIVTDSYTITDCSTTKEAYLFHEHYGIKELMFSIAGTTYGDFIEMITSDIDEYIADYRQTYMGGE